MRVPYGWVREFVDGLPDVGAVAERLTMSGLEVESVSTPDPHLVDGLVTARIVEMGRHPNADRLTLCRVDDGSEIVSVVCGATNHKAGDGVVLARPGTVLPDGRKISRSKIRGEESRGMLCSAAEVGLGDEQSGIIILDPSVAPGQNAARLLGIDDAILEIGVTPNRGDCLSVRGIAREIAAVCDLSLTAEFRRETSSSPGAGRVSIRIDADDACPLYTGIEVRDVRVGPSPPWLAARLRACGLRPINNVVDGTNYLLWECGQPLHAFDADLLVGSEISVARAGDERAIETLDGQSRRLEAHDLVIRDGKGAVALAGVMGGARTAVGSETRNLFLESAIFAPRSVRATSRRLGLISDSSYRFERGVDPAGVERTLVRAATLIAEIAGGRVEGGVCRAGAGVPARPAIRLRPARIEALLGGSVSREEAGRLLVRLGAGVSSATDGALAVTTPTHRHDLEREIDLIEEVARLRGYDTIDAVAPAITRSEPVGRALGAAAGRVRGALCTRGLSEIVALSFCTPGDNRRFHGLHDVAAEPVCVENPLRSDAGELRHSLLPALLAARAANVRTGGAHRSDLFTVARTFSAAAACPEIDAVGGLIAGPRRSRGPGDAGEPTFWDVKGLVDHVVSAIGCRTLSSWTPLTGRADLHPRAAAEARIDEQASGYGGEIHPEVLAELDLEGPVLVFELDLGRLAAMPARARYRPIPRFPTSSRDVSLLVGDDLTAGRVLEEMTAAKESLLESAVVFDEYRGPGLPAGRRALAFRLTYRAEDRTLTDDEVSEAHRRVLDRVVTALGVEPRA
jgi:phenylalanyl-tRNA synthetase beta chain